MSMKLGLINSAWAQAGRDTAFGIRMTREIGFDCIDLFADPLDIDAKERRLLRTECARNDLPVISVACVAVGDHAAEHVDRHAADGAAELLR
jgi:hypothetical protein